jgi:hypothetical protein
LVSKADAVCEQETGFRSLEQYWHEEMRRPFNRGAPQCGRRKAAASGCSPSRSEYDENEGRERSRPFSFLSFPGEQSESYDAQLRI